MLVKFSNHIPHLVVGTLLLPDRESAKIHSNQANPIIRGPNQSLTSPTGMHNSLPLLNPNYSIGNVHPHGVEFGNQRLLPISFGPLNDSSNLLKKHMNILLRWFD